MTPSPSHELYAFRHHRLFQSVENTHLDAVILNPSPTLYYLTGIHFHLSERPVLAFFKPGSPLALVLPRLEAQKAVYTTFPIQTFPYDEDPTGWVEVLRKAAEWCELNTAHLGLEPRYMRLLEFNLLESALPQATFESGEALLSALRMVKDAAEVQAMRQAARIAQEALQATLPIIRAGVTEREIAAELIVQLYRAGSDPTLPFTPIVSGGPNSANPHAFPSNRPLTIGDLLVIDWGAAFQGYISDITRTFGIGQLEPEFERIAQVVLEANSAGRVACIPETQASAVDRAARSVIEAAGYGVYFTHRTGHGLGLEGHEEPYIRGDNPDPLLTGMSFTVEPGIYLPGRGGVRIEDDIVISATGSESLTDLPRPVQILPA